MRSRLAISLLVGSVSWTACGGDDLVQPPARGQIRVTTVTTGTEPDPDGYTVRLDTSPDRTIADNASVTLSADPGEHAVELSGVAGNCAVVGDARRVVTVESDQVTDVAFQITCAATVGGLLVTATTMGDLPDADGYTVRIDDGDPQPLPANGSVTVGGVTPGSHSVLLGGVADNCAVQGGNPVAVEVVAGGPLTVAFQIVCRGGVAQWTPMESGSDADLTGVWTAGDGGGFAVGERGTNRGLEGVVLSLNGDTWTRVFRETDLRPRAVWGSANDDVYVGGFERFGSGWIRHFDGDQWSEVPFPQGELEGIGFQSIWGTAADDIWAVGFDAKGVISTSAIYHYDGAGWSRFGVAGDVDPALTDVWGFSPNDVYATGRDNFLDPTGGAIIHYDGTQWISVLDVESLVLNAVWGSSPTDVYAAGFQITGEGDDSEVAGAIWHYDGIRWSPVTLPPIGVLDEIWGSSASDIYAVGDEGVLHFNGTAWTFTTLTRETLLGVWGGAPGEVLAVGIGGTILRGTP